MGPHGMPSTKVGKRAGLKPAALGCLLLASCGGGPSLEYPESIRRDIVDDYHGTPVADPYRWLEDTDAPETRAWIEAQNAVTFGYFEQIPFRQKVTDRLTALWNYERYGTPFREGGRYFYTRNDGLQNQSVLYVREQLQGPSRVLLDPNRLSEDGTVALTSLAVSPDGRWLAYGTASGGSDWQAFRVREVESGRDRDDHLQHIKFSGMSWTRDNRGFFYSRYPEPDERTRLLGTNIDQKLYYHVVGQPQSADRLIYERPDQPEWGFSAEVTEDGRYAVVYVWHGTSPRNRLYYLDLHSPLQPRINARMVRLLDAADAAYTFIGNRGPIFYLTTDLEAPRGRVIAIDIRRPDRDHWHTVIPESEAVLEQVAIIGGHLVVHELVDARSRVRLLTLQGEPIRELPLPAPGSIGAISGQADAPEMFYAFTSFLYPTSIYRYELTAEDAQLFHAPALDFEPDRYMTEQVYYGSPDGTTVPMFLTYRRDLVRNGDNPVLLYGYGGFRISLTPSFSVSNLLWIENGGIYAVANLRGGGEYGEAWHLAGIKEHKQNVFDDFIAAAEYLIEQGYTRPERLAMAGGSNGGLLVGAVMTQRPDLFAVALPAVGVMDMLRFHRFTIGWAWTSDYGSSDDPEGFRYLYAYSPLHNLVPGTHYPATLVTTADHDDRVVPGHSFKFAAALQQAHAGRSPVLIRIETRAGHGAGKPTAMQIEEAADRLTFTMFNMGMRP